MVYTPSEALEAALEQASSGIWLDPLQDGRITLVCKVPDIIIRRVHQGAKCSLLIAVIRVKSDSIACLGFQVQDEPGHPFTATMPWVMPLAYEQLRAVLVSRSTILHCLNELNHPVLRAGCRLDAAAAQATLRALDCTSPYLLTPSNASDWHPRTFREIINLALDRFQVEAFRPDGTPPSEFVEASGRIPLEPECKDMVEVFEVTPTISGGPFSVDDKNEGPKQEKAVHLLIDSIYPGQTFRNPLVQNGSSARELADVLGFGRESICLVESKGVSVFATEIGRSAERRVATVTKHIEKALNQLRGAVRNVRSNSKLTDSNAKPIEIPERESLLVHSIVVLSELYSFVDWQEVARKLTELSENDRYKALFHVVDTSELSYLVRASKDASTFNKYLIQRWVMVKAKGTAYGRVLVPHRALTPAHQPWSPS